MKVRRPPHGAPADSTPMSRAIDTASNLSNLDARLTAGFDRVDSALSHLAVSVARLTEATRQQDLVLSSLAESRSQQRHIAKWFAGILAALITAVAIQTIRR